MITPEATPPAIIQEAAAATENTSICANPNIIWDFSAGGYCPAEDCKELEKFDFDEISEIASHRNFPLFQKMLSSPAFRCLSREQKWEVLEKFSNHSEVSINYSCDRGPGNPDVQGVMHCLPHTKTSETFTQLLFELAQEDRDIEEYLYGKIIPRGTLEFQKPRARIDIIIIAGPQEYKGEDWFYEGLKTNLLTVMRNTQFANILYVNLDNQNLSLQDLETEVKQFVKKENSLFVLSMIHGFEILPFDHHRLTFAHHNRSNDVIAYFTGHYISSKNYMEVFTKTADEKPITFWQCSCQGNKLIPVAQEIFPQNSLFISESKGYVTRPDLAFYALMETLKSDTDFSIDRLLQRYTYAATATKDLFSSDYSPMALNINPVITTIGGESSYLSQRANTFAKDLAEGNISAEKIEAVIKNFCHTQTGNESICIQHVNTLLNTSRFKKPQGHSVSACTAHHGEGSYVSAHYIKRWLRMELYSGPYPIPESCRLDNAPDYMLSMGIGYTYERIFQENTHPSRNKK